MAKQSKESIKRIIIHCAATTPAMDIGVETIRKWHREQGWEDVGYHYVIRRNGTIEKGREDTEVGAHVAGKNTNSIGVCLVGGITSKGKPENNFTDDQFRTLRELVYQLMTLYPNATVHGHNEFANKACPSFDVQEWMKKTYAN